MRPIIFIMTILLLSIGGYSQDKHNHVYFNKLIEVEGTEYMLATIQHRGKIEKIKSQYLLFINTKTGESHKVNFSKDSYIQDIKQVKIDHLKINKIVITAKTIDLDGKKGISWTDPIQLIVLSTNGLEHTQLTDSNLFVRTWAVNKTTGKIVVTGYYDTDGNGKYNKTDKNEIGIYDLKTLKLIQKI